MKITCDACAAKYSIADDKIAGRTVRVRCKKCASSIVVRGALGSARAAASPVDAPWHLVIDDEQRGPLSEDEVVGLLSEGAADAETLVWREGYGEWTRLGDDPELAARWPVTDASSPGAHSPFAPGAHGPFAPSPFAPNAHDPSTPSAHSPFAPTEPALGAPDDESARAEPMASHSLTGARNDSSVLFSLSNLQALSGASEPAPKTPVGSDASGLIDIRALAAAPSRAAREPEGRVEDLLPFGGASSALGAPVVMPEPERGPGRTPIVAGITVAIVAIAAAAVAVVWIGAPDSVGPDPSDVLVAAPDVPEPASSPAAGPAEPLTGAESPVHVQTTTEEPPAAADRPVDPSTHAPLVARPAQEDSAPEVAAAEATPAPRHRPRPVHRPAPREPRDRLAAAAPEGDPIAHLLAPQRAPSPAPSRPTGPQTPSRAAVVAAMNGVSSAVRACGDGAHGTVTVRVAFAGSDGRATSAEVRNGSVAPPVRSCVARAVRAASVPAFTQGSFSVTYPFRL